MASLLCAIDFSESSEEGAALAAHLAESRDSDLVLLYVETQSAQTISALSDDSMREHKNWLASRLKTAQNRLHSADRVEAVLRVCEDGPAAGVVEMADEIDAELIVLGSNGSGLRHLLLGSVAQKVAREANRPVLIVRGGAPLVPFERALVAVDFSSVSLPLASLARSMVSHTTELLHVVEQSAVQRSMPHRNDVRALRELLHAEATKKLEALAAELPDAASTVSLAVRSGPIAGSILELALESGADVIAVASHEPRGLGQRLLGTTADRVLRHASVPVLVLPAHSL